MLTGGQTNMTKLIAAFRNFANASKNYVTLAQCATVKLIINNDYFPKQP